MEQRRSIETIMPSRRGNTKVATVAQLSLINWTDEEKRMIEAVTAENHRFQELELRRLLHNRTAAEKNLHIIPPFGNRQGLCVKCNVCKYTAAIGSFQKFIETRCLRVGDAGKKHQTVCTKRATTIEQHNATASA